MGILILLYLPAIIGPCENHGNRAPAAVQAKSSIITKSNLRTKFFSGFSCIIYVVCMHVMRPPVPLSFLPFFLPPGQEVAAKK